MDLLKKELARKKQALQSAKAAATAASSTIDDDDGSPNNRPNNKTKTKFLKASELRRLQEEQELLQQKQFKQKQQQQQQQQEEVVSNNNRKKRPRTERREDATAHHDKGDDDSIKKSLSAAEVTRELRALGLAVRFFGETAADRHKRLLAAYQDRTEKLASWTERQEFRLQQEEGHDDIRNPLLQKDAADDDEEDKEDDAKEAVTDKQKTKAKKQKIEQRVTDKEQKDHDDDDVSNDPHKQIYRYFKGLLREWEDDLLQRPDDVKRSVAGRNETKTLKQCKDYIRPLFKLCKNRTLEEGLLQNILKIVQYCQQGEFVKANDVYMDTAIGRAAWPIGVTQVGIHARTGRSKIESQNIAHVMNSEMQRKYLTSVKRLVTFAQKKRTDVDPSKKVF